MAIVSQSINRSQEQVWLGVKDAAVRCGVGHNKIRELFHKADFPVQWIGRKQVVRADDLDRYIKEGRAS